MQAFTAAPRRTSKVPRRWWSGPTNAWRDQTREQVEEAHWAYLEHKLWDAGVSVQEGSLKTLSHDVEMSDRLRSRLVDSAPT